MKEIVQSLYNLIVQGYDHQGAPTVGAMRRDMYGIACYVRAISVVNVFADSILLND